MNVSEQPIDDEMMGSIRGCATDALMVLGPEFVSEDPPAVVEAIDAFAYRWQKGDRPAADVVEDTEQARLIFGSLWGEQLVKQFGWQWAQVNFGENSFTFGVVSPDRSMVINPLDFLLDCLSNPGVDVTVMLAFNMLLERSIPQMRPRSYIDVMQGVHRIVPRD